METTSVFEMCPHSRRSFLWILLILFSWFSPGSSTECACDNENISHPGCGIIPSTSTIFNGSPASYPWMVFLFSAPENGQQSFCGGSLISDLQVVTAAHCVAGKTTDDIAVLLADKNAQEKSIRMPTFSESRETHEGKNATVTGWGLTEKGAASTNQLLSVEVPIISNKNCQNKYQWIRRQKHIF